MARLKNQYNLEYIEGHTGYLFFRLASFRNRRITDISLKWGSLTDLQRDYFWTLAQNHVDPQPMFIPWVWRLFTHSCLFSRNELGIASSTLLIDASGRNNPALEEFNA